MNDEDLRRTVIEALQRIAPEADLTTLPPDALLREELDLDSMDFLHFVLALHDRLGVEIPEAHYPRLSTVQGTMSYLSNQPTKLPPSH